MALKDLNYNTVCSILEFMNRRTVFEFSLVSKNANSHFFRFFIGFSGLQALESKEINYFVLNQGDFSAENVGKYVEYMKNNKEVVIFLIKVVKSSKFIIQLGNIAANAITLLNYYGYDFSYEDLSEIQIPGANLCGGRLMYTNFTKANLKSTIFDKSYTKQAQFDHSSLKNSSLTLKTQPIACKSLCIITTSIKSDEKLEPKNNNNNNNSTINLS